MPGFLSSSMALTVYTLPSVTAITPEKLQQFAFRSIDEIPEPRGWGWTNIDDMFDTAWRVSVPEKGSFLCFGFRVDTRRVSGGVLRKHLADALREEEAQAAAQGVKVKRSRKKELKEVLAAKLLAQAEPVPVSTDVVVDTDNGQMYVAANSAATLELFESHFEASFGLRPEKIEADPAQGTQLLRVIYEHGLTIGYGEHEYTLTEGGQGSLVHPENGAHVSARDEPETIAKSLEAGLELSRLKVIMVRKDEEDLEWTFMLGDAFTLTGLKTPKVESEDDDPDSAWLEKLYLIQLVVGVLRAAFARLEQ